MTSIAPTTQIQAVQGTVHGGQQPIIGASVQLIVAGTSGYGVNTSGSVLGSTTTSSTGTFTLSPPSTCPANSGLVYILATGGDAGAGPNSSIAEAAILGPCSGLGSLTSVSITEVTTVAAAYALAPFASVTPGSGNSPGTTNIGTSSTNLTGLYNAAAAAGNLASLTTGQAPAATSISGIVLPTSEMNTLANILASCVNSGVSGVSTSNCSSLFTDATPPGTTSTPTDTFQAAIDIALNPGNNAGPLYLLATPSAPFQPTLSSAPGDFALGIQYNGGNLGLAQPQGIDIDAQGNAWVSTYYCGRGCAGVNGLVELSPSGVVSPSSGVYITGMANPQAVAITSGGVVEVADFDLGIFAYVPAGATGSGTTYTTTGARGSVGPTGLAIDNNDGSLWIAGYTNNSVLHINQSGTAMTGSPFAAGSAPWGLALNPARDVVVADSDTTSTGSNSSVTVYTPAGSGTYSSGTTFSTGTGQFPSDVAFDNAGNFWLTVNSGPLVYSGSTGRAISPQAGYTSNSDNISDSIEIDGLGRAFVSNNSASNQTQPGSLTVWANNGTLLSTANNSYGYYANKTIMVDPFIPHGLALDASGNCWIAGNTPNVVTELIGIAAPVVTPLSVQVSTNQIGVRP